MNSFQMAAEAAAGGANQRDRADQRGGGVISLVLRGLVVYLAVGLAGRLVVRPLEAAAGSAPHRSSAGAARPYTPSEAEPAGAMESRARFRGGLTPVHANAWPPLAPLEMRVYLSNSPALVLPSSVWETPALSTSVEPSRGGSGGGGEGGGSSSEGEGGRPPLLDVLSAESLSRGVLIVVETGIVYGSPDGSDCSRQIDVSLRTTAALRENRTSVWAHVYVYVATGGRGDLTRRGGDGQGGASGVGGDGGGWVSKHEGGSGAVGNAVGGASLTPAGVAEAHIPLVRIKRKRRKAGTKNLLGGETETKNLLGGETGTENLLGGETGRGGKGAAGPGMEGEEEAPGGEVGEEEEAGGASGDESCARSDSGGGGSSDDGRSGGESIASSTAVGMPQPATPVFSQPSAIDDPTGVIGEGL